MSKDITIKASDLPDVYRGQFEPIVIAEQNSVTFTVNAESHISSVRFGYTDFTLCMTGYEALELVTAGLAALQAIGEFND